MYIIYYVHKICIHTLAGTETVHRQWGYRQYAGISTRSVKVAAYAVLALGGRRAEKAP